jgi:AraC family transcriptional activator of pobA
MAQGADIERFSLYGEAYKPAGERFIHLEMLDKRSRPANWDIKAHSHSDLHHVFAISAGRGAVSVDGVETSFKAPCIFTVPCGAVHALRMAADTEGRVLTFSDAALRSLSAREPKFAALFDCGAWVAPSLSNEFDRACILLARESGWEAEGSFIAVEAHLTVVLVEALRLHNQADVEAGTLLGPQTALTARYRGLLEEHFREHPTVTWSAARLGVTESRLRAACRASAGRSPAQLLHERLRLEAVRVMRYSNMSVAQVAAYLGFGDPAYFSRFFTQSVGASPRSFRKARLQSVTESHAANN